MYTFYYQSTHKYFNSLAVPNWAHIILKHANIFTIDKITLTNTPKPNNVMFIVGRID